MPADGAGGGKDEGGACSREALMSIIAYSFCSGGMLLINKLCMRYLPVASLNSELQFFFTFAVIMLLKNAGALDVDDFEWKLMKPYMLYVLIFATHIFASMRAVGQSNVETIIVFKSLAPLIICVLEYVFLGRALPSLKSTAALLGLIVGAVGYVQTDSAFQLDGWSAYTWVLIYFALTCVLMVFGKHIAGIGFKNMWGPTLYTNTLSMPVMLVLGVATQEQKKIPDIQWVPQMYIVVTAGCIVGVAISYTGWWCRNLTTATCFTIIGVVNKLLTVLGNMIVFEMLGESESHASLAGILSLLLCLAAAAAYEQAPMRASSEARPTAPLV
jgi:hypothetical protein